MGHFGSDRRGFSLGGQLLNATVVRSGVSPYGCAIAFPPETQPMKITVKLLAASVALAFGMAALAAPIVIKYSHVVADITPTG